MLENIKSLAGRERYIALLHCTVALHLRPAVWQQVTLVWLNVMLAVCEVVLMD